MGEVKMKSLKYVQQKIRVIRNFTVKHGSGDIAIGTEKTTMICNAYMHDDIMENPNSLLYLKTRHPC